MAERVPPGAFPTTEKNTIIDCHIDKKYGNILAVKRLAGSLVGRVNDMKRVLLGALVASASASVFGAVGQAEAQSVTQFDMVCVGSKTEKQGLKEAIKPWQVRYSIDLDVQQFCPGRDGSRCAAPLPIKTVEPHRIVLTDSWQLIGRDRAGSTIEISRSDGKLTGTAIIPGISYDVFEAACSLSEFTPLPKTLF